MEELQNLVKEAILEATKVNWPQAKWMTPWEEATDEHRISFFLNQKCEEPMAIGRMIPLDHVKLITEHLAQKLQEKGVQLPTSTK